MKRIRIYESLNSDMFNYFTMSVFDYFNVNFNMILLSIVSLNQ